MKEVIAWKTKDKEYQVLINPKVFIVDEDSTIDYKTMAVEDAGLISIKYMDDNYGRFKLTDLPLPYIAAIKEKLKHLNLLK
jgi:hypothetical protein